MRAWEQNYEYILRNYGKNLGRGTRVRVKANPPSERYDGKEGTVLGTHGTSVAVKLEGVPDKWTLWHPHDIEVV